MSLTVLFQDEQERISAKQKQQLTDLAQTAGRMLGVKTGEVSVTFVDDTQIQTFNAHYRGKDQPTDVLSFPQYEPEELYEEGQFQQPPLEEQEPFLIGDMVISVQTAERQAEEYGHSFGRELGFLFIHGLLHLLGFDHDNTQREQEMFQLQEDILAQHQLIR